MADDITPPQVNSGDLQNIQLHRALAQALLSQRGDGSAVGSPWQAVNRAVSPLLGALMERSAGKQYGALSDAAAPELAKIAQSSEPLTLAAQSTNPLVRAMIPELAQAQIQGTIGARNKGAETAAVGEARLGYEPSLTGANAQALVAPHVAEAVQTEQQTMPFKEKLMRLQNALGISADLAKPVPLAPGSVLTNQKTGQPVGNPGGQTAGPWSNY